MNEAYTIIITEEYTNINMSSLRNQIIGYVSQILVDFPLNTGASDYESPVPVLRLY